MVRGACGEPERERECEPVRPPPPAAAVRATDSSRYQLMEKTSLKTVPGPNSTRSHPSVHLHWDFTCVGICEFPFFCSSAWISERWH
ncbi:uncharacterized protein LOC124418339 isoform X2 [Gallus gallus]|uniref:uncharacterized protein LOC124418339 isoform X2 n=1 Tax=Gallus gallus TaxID=9031 RepID=UPI001EFFFF0E|nr:uncharacterized protein LOC124418339 isoform X2 [Gallus gallus]